MAPEGACAQMAAASSPEAILRVVHVLQRRRLDARLRRAYRTDRFRVPGVPATDGHSVPVATIGVLDPSKHLPVSTV